MADMTAPPPPPDGYVLQSSTPPAPPPGYQVVAQQPAASPAPVPAAAQADGGGWWQTIKDNLGQVGRSAEQLGEGAISFGDLLATPIRAGYNALVSPENQLTTGAQALRQETGVADAAPGSLQGYVDAVNRGLGGTAVSVGTGGVLAGSANPVASAVGNTLLTNPGAQAAAATTGSLAAQATKDAGGGPVLQTLAGIGGGFVPSVATGLGNVANALTTGTATDAGRQAIVANLFSRVLGKDPISGQPNTVSVTPSAVPGVQPTLAETAANPGISQLQRTVRNSPENAADFALRDTANNASRQNYLTNTFGTPEDIANAIADRGTEAGALYGTARALDQQRIAAAQAAGVENRSLTGASGTDILSNGAIKPSPELQALAQRPAVAQAIKTAKQIMADQGNPISDPLQSVSGLHLVKMALDDALNTGPQQGIGKTALSAIGDSRDALLQQIEKVSPEYGQARQAFREASGPINQMQLGQAIVSKGTNNVRDPNTGLETLLPNSYAGAVNNADKIAQTVTGQKNATAANILTPEQSNALRNVQGDLDRVAYAQNAGRATGSNTVQNALSQNVLDHITSAVGLPGLANTKFAQTLIAPLDKIYSAFGIPDQIKGLVARVMLDPTSAEAQAVLSRIPDQQRAALFQASAPYLQGISQATNASSQNQNALQRYRVAPVIQPQQNALASPAYAGAH